MSVAILSAKGIGKTGLQCLLVAGVLSVFESGEAEIGLAKHTKYDLSVSPIGPTRSESQRVRDMGGCVDPKLTPRCPHWHAVRPEACHRVMSRDVALVRAGMQPAK